jgi:tetraacyldisaccharide 4'-kinase
MDSCLRRNDSIEELKGKKIFAFCGIGNPDAFIKTIKGLGANLVGAKIYDDHYHYNEKDIEDIRTKAKELKAELVLTTQKDWSKIVGNFRIEICDFQSSIPFAYLKIELKFVSGEDKIIRLIEDALAGKIALLQKQ